jgi:hypothetical protein
MLDRDSDPGITAWIVAVLAILFFGRSVVLGLAGGERRGGGTDEAGDGNKAD